MINVFGKNHSDYPDILLNQMYARDISVKSTMSPTFKRLIKAYIDFFGIPHIGLQVRALYFKRFIEHFEFISILDAGCGLGFYSFYLSQKYPLRKVDACDNNPETIEIVRKIRDRLQFDNLHVFQKNLVDLSESNKYDLVICIDVLEHIKEDKRVIENIYKALRPGGIFYLHVPQKNQKVHFQRFRNLTCKGHERKGYVKEQMIQLLEKEGFEIRKMTGTFGWFTSLAWELNQISLLALSIAALVFPILMIVSWMEIIGFSTASTTDKRGWSSEILTIAQKMPKKHNAV